MAEFWFRFHHGTVNDPKWRVVASRASKAMSRDVTIGHVLAVWAVMMECASQATPRGELSNWSHEDVGAALGMPEEEVAAIHDAMQGKTLDGNKLTGWNRRQINKEDPTSAERQRRKRERDAMPESHDGDRDEGARHDVSRNVTTDKKRIEEKKEHLPPTSSAPAELELVSDEPTTSGKAPRRNGTRLPDDWKPSPELIAEVRAERADVDLRTETAKFRDHFHAKTGKDATKLNWDATYRNWIRNVRGPSGYTQRAEPARQRQELRR